MGVQYDNSWAEVEAVMEALQPRYDVASDAWNKGFALLGAGLFGQGAAHFLRKEGATLTCFLDNQPEKQGTRVEDLTIQPVRDYASSSAHFVLITARHAVHTLQAQLAQANIPCLSYDTFIVCRYIERLKQVRNHRLGDTHSRAVFDHILLAMLTGDMNHCQAVCEGNQYFCIPPFFNGCNEHFVDAGAYVGDTVERFIWAQNGAFKQVYAFEPGQAQQNAFRKRMQRLAFEWAFTPDTVELVCAGLGERDSMMPFSTNAIAPQSMCFNKSTPVSENETAIAVRSLDSFLNSRPVTFLKADVEGMEMLMLRGAEQTIRTHRPKLALSLYHNASDLFEIPEYLAALMPEYRMALRHHAPVLMETVLYAWATD